MTIEERILPNGSHRIRFVPEINLGHIVSASVFLVTTGIAWATMDQRVATLEREARLERAEHKEAVVNVETRMMARINEERARLDQTQVRTADDIREMKQIMRDGFRDLDQKLERKQDKPGR
jgi:hypothetical protein